MEVSRTSGRTHYVDSGSSDGVDSLALVLIHGLGGHVGHWADVVPGLFEHVRVIVVDLPGFGESGLLDEPITLDSMADAIADVMSDVGLSSAVLVGHSMGALVVARFAARHPHRTRAIATLGGTIQQFTGLNSVRSFLRFCVTEPRRARAILWEVGTLGWHVPRVFVAALLRSPRLRRVALGIYVDQPVRLKADTTLALLAGAGSKGHWPAVRAVMRANADLDQPALRALPDRSFLCITGIRDRIAPVELARAYCARIPGSVGIEIADCGHLPMLEQPQAVITALLEFLDSIAVKP